MRQAQRGGFVMGMIVGLLIGLALALAVALYVTKAPIPFVNKVPQRSSDRDAEEREKNRNWDPNSPLYGNRPARPASAPPLPAAPVAPAPAEPVTAAASEPGAITAAPPPAVVPPRPAASATARPAAPARDPAVILGDKPPGDAGDGSLSTKPRDDPFTYYVQAGAYGRPEEAEQQRARLAMMGIETRVTEREQAGRTVYRVRVGPFDKRDQADQAKERLESAAIEAALVRVQK